MQLPSSLFLFDFALFWVEFAFLALVSVVLRFLGFVAEFQSSHGCVVRVNQCLSLSLNC